MEPVTTAGRARGQDGFTLIELMIALTLIAILMSIAVPAYQSSVIKAREAALLEDLHMMRDAIDKYYSDTGKYPDAISELVEKKYLRAMPIDPFTGSTETWEEKPPDFGPGVYDVASGSDLTGRNGVPYNEW